MPLYNTNVSVFNILRTSIHIGASWNVFTKMWPVFYKNAWDGIYLLNF